jgi:outer membrane immunogenic protein
MRGGVMKKVLLATVVFSVLGAQAMAADMPVKAPAYKAPPPVVFSWTGCYVGGNVGGLWVNKEWINRTPFDPLLDQSYGTHSANSWAGGVQAGCNYQSPVGLVVGLQGDYDWTNAKGSNVNVLIPALSDNTNVRSLASLTGRIGYAWDRFLGYVKGGAAWERDDYTINVIATGATFATGGGTRGGWTVGIGGEYAFTDWLSGFAEYDYYNFGTQSSTFVCAGAPCFFGGLSSTPINIKESKSVFKVGLNLRWGEGPVVAKY